MYLRRVKFFLVFVFVVLGVLVVRLGHLQIVRGRTYREQFARRLRNWRPLAVRRGSILDRTGTRPLAIDEPCFDFSLDYQFLAKSNVETQAEFGQRARRTWALAERLATAHGVDLDGKLRRIRRRVEAIEKIVRAKTGGPAAEAYWPHVVVRGLSDGEAAEVRAQLEGTVGALLEPSHRRRYPHGRLASHLIGVLGEVSRDEIERLNVSDGRVASLAEELAARSGSSRARAYRMACQLVHYRPGDFVGKSGVEKMSEAQLRGRRGYQCLRRTDAGREVVAESPADHGADIRLTVDIDLQQFLTALFEAEGRTGSAVVLSVPDGEVLALVSVPSYDLNTYRQDYRQLAADQVDLPLLHRAVARRYPPGSTAKVIAALAGLGGGKIGPDTHFTCDGKLIPGREGFGCPGRHGDIGLLDAIKRSCNIYFYKVGDSVGPRQLGMWLSLFGYDRPPGTGLPEERAGIVPTARWLAANGERLYRADAWLMAIGQGKVEATPLHVANAMATIARNGKLLPPTVILGGNDWREPTPLPVRLSDVKLIKRGMRKVVGEPGGTGYAAFHMPGSTLPAATVCGKSGTAETPPHRVGGLVVRSGNTAWFAGFAPYDRPRIAFAVAIEYVQHGGGGSVAGPFARELVAMCDQLGYLDATVVGYARTD